MAHELLSSIADIDMLSSAEGGNTVKSKYPESRHREGEEGSTILLGLFVVLLGASMIVVGLTLLTTTRDAIVHELNLKGQATSAADAGISDALSWFRRQETQPVEVFDPILDPDNEIYDTEDPNIGIVREFPINVDTRYYGRYEVMKTDPVSAEAVVADISPQRIISPEAVASGIVWYVESKGMVFEKNDPEKAYNEPPNRVIRRVTLASEIQRLSILPTAAAAIISDVGRVTVSTNGRVLGMSSKAIVYDKKGGGSVRLTGGVVEGGTSWAAIFEGEPDNMATLIGQVFATTPDGLKGIADYFVTTVDDLPDTLPTLGVIYVEGNATFTSARPLSGGGVLIVDGDLTLSDNCNSFYSGLVFVTGDYTQRGPSMVSGSVMVLGDSDIRSASGPAEIMYDADILNIVRQQLGQYRASRSPYHVDNRGV